MVLHDGGVEMLYKGKKGITGISRGKRAMTALYKGVSLVWETVKSCFGKGYWINDKPWREDNGWKN